MHARRAFFSCEFSLRPAMAVAAAMVVLAGCGSPAAPPLDAHRVDRPAGGEPPGEVTLYFNARVNTLNDAAPTANAIAVKSGRILAVGDFRDVQKSAGPQAVRRNMNGRTIVPGLIDAHGHFASVARMLSLADLQPPPSGSVSSMSDLLAVLRRWRDKHPGAGWIQGNGYDDSLLAERRHPTRDDLDAISADIPIAVAHVSGHLMSCNSACLAASGITANTDDPKGGVIRRRPGSREPNGVLEEAALQLVIARLPRPTPQQDRKSVV